jgi:hypothetical protein
VTDDDVFLPVFTLLNARPSQEKLFFVAVAGGGFFGVTIRGSSPAAVSPLLLSRGSSKWLVKK